MLNFYQFKVFLIKIAIILVVDVYVAFIYLKEQFFDVWIVILCLSKMILLVSTSL